MTTPDDAALLSYAEAHDDPLVRLLAQRYAALVAELAAHRRALALQNMELSEDDRAKE